MRYRQLTSPITFGITQGIVGVDGVSSEPVLPITSNLALWMDANDAATFSVDSYNGEVSSWTDKSSNARVFTPTTVNNFFVRQRKPQWNNRPVVAFSNTANFGLACPAYNVQEDFAANGTDITVFAAVHSDDNILTFGTVYYHLSSGSNGHYLRLNQTAGNVRFLAVNGSTFIAGSNANYIGAPKIISMRRSGNTLQGFVNGSQQGADVNSTATAATSANAQMFIGTSTVSGGSGLLGDLAELIIYKRALTVTERNQVEDYLARKWITGAVVS